METRLKNTRDTGTVFIAFAAMALTSCGANSGGSGSVSGGIAGTVGSENILLTSAQMLSDGFSYGPVDGTLGAIDDAGTYTLFGSAYATTGGVQGAFSFTGNLTSITGSSLTALLTNGADPNGYVFDDSYAGGGPVIPLYNGTTLVGYLMSYHGEYWCNSTHSCTNANSSGSSPNFYSSLGLAFSSDTSAPYSFTKMGEVVEPYVSHEYVFSNNENLDIGGGAMMIGDANGDYIPDFSSLADKSSAYIYIFFSDMDLSNTVSPCDSTQCVGVARAPYVSVVTAATGGDYSAFPTLFEKYYQGSFSQPATSSDADDTATSTANSGHYTAVLSDNCPLYPSVVWVTSINSFLMTYSTGNDQIDFQTGSGLLSWSGNISSMQISESGWTLLEPSLLGESTDPLTSNGFPYVYYVKSNNWNVNNWRSADYVLRQISY